MIDYRILLKLQDKYALRLKRVYLQNTRQTIRNTNWNLTKDAVWKGDEATYNSIRWTTWNPMSLLKDAYTATWNKLDLHKEAVVLDASQFEMPNPSAERWLWAFAGQDVAEITDQNRRAIRMILTRGMKNQQSPIDTALEIQQTLGLTEAQAKAVLTYKDGLIKAGLKESMVNSLTKKYYNNLLNYRAETISITETARAVDQATMDYYQEAQRRGVLSADEYQLYWLTTPDDRRCEQCLAMNGHTDEITNGSIQGKTVPLHPRCRCIIQVRKK